MGGPGEIGPAVGPALLEVPSPSLEDLQVEVLSPPSPTAEELVERLHHELWSLAPRTVRSAGEPIEWGDEVECDILMVAGGRVIPGGARACVGLEMRPMAHLPGLVEALVGLENGGATFFELRLPEDYPVTELRSLEVSVLVEVRGAAAVQCPSLEDIEALRGAGLGNDLDEAMDNLVTLIDEEQAEELVVRATQEALRAMAARVQLEIPQGLSDRELELAWRKSEEPLLRAKGFDDELLAKALGDYLTWPQHRAEVELRLRIGAGLGALIRDRALVPEQAAVQELLNQTAGELGFGLEEVGDSLGDAERLAIANHALYLRAVEEVMEAARITVRG